MVFEKNIIKRKEKLSFLAEKVASECFGAKLDYSINSIQLVEQMLGEFHKEYLRTKDDSGLKGIALEFGCYLIKVIESHFPPGILKKDHPMFGSDSYPYEWQGVEIFPYSWCLKRIFDGPEDNVWTKFQTLIIKKSNGAA